MSELNESKDEDYPPIPEIIKTVSYLATFIVAVFTGRQFLPLELQFALAVIFAGSSVLFILWIWRRPFRRYAKTWRRDRIARRNFPELIRLLERFRQFVDPGTSQPHFFLYQLKGRAQDFNSIPLPSNPYYSQQFAENLSYGSKSWKSNLVSFKWLENSLSTLIQYYNETYLSSPVKEVLNIIKKASETEAPPDAPQVPEDIRKGFNSARVRWVSFLQDFEGFTYQVSKELGKYQVKIGTDWLSFDYVNAYRLEPPEELPTPIEF